MAKRLHGRHEASFVSFENQRERGFRIQPEPNFVDAMNFGSTTTTTFVSLAVATTNLLCYCKLIELNHYNTDTINTMLHSFSKYH